MASWGQGQAGAGASLDIWPLTPPWWHALTYLMGMDLGDPGRLQQDWKAREAPQISKSRRRE